MIPLIVAFSLLALYWLHDKAAFPAFRRFSLKHRRTALALGYVEQIGCYAAAGLALAAGLDFVLRMFR